MTPGAHAAAGRARLSRPALIVLGGLTAVAPLITDLYLPALPDIRNAYDTTDAMAQMTLSACLIGLALGQLVAGPWSDRAGRMRPLTWGVALLALTTFLCAIAPSITVLLALRFAQGLVGAAAMVVARAIVRDVYDGARAAKLFSELMLVMGLAPVLGPLIGGQILRLTDWRGVFAVLSGLCIALLVATRTVLHETLPPERRSRDERVPAAVHALLVDRRFIVLLGLNSLLGATLFSYITLSSFVFQHEYALSVTGYSLALGGNAIGMVVGGLVNSRLVLQHGPHRRLHHNLTGLALAGTATGIALVVDAPLPLVLVPLWFVLACLGGSLGNATALGLQDHPSRAGTASALLGGSTFLSGAAVPPLVSLGGAMGATLVVTTWAAFLSLPLISRSML